MRSRLEGGSGAAGPRKNPEGFQVRKLNFSREISDFPVSSRTCPIVTFQRKVRGSRKSSRDTVTQASRFLHSCAHLVRYGKRKVTSRFGGGEVALAADLRSRVFGGRRLPRKFSGF